MSPYEQMSRSLTSGWNTWNTRSVMSHVYLPHGFSIQLGIKENKETKYLREMLIGRQSKDSEIVRPGTRTYDGSYTELTLLWQDMELFVQSAAIDDDLVLLVTPVQKQLSPARLIIECGILWNRAGYVRNNNGIIEGVFNDQTIKVYPSSPPVDEFHVSASTPYYALLLDSPVGISTGRPRSIEEIHSLIEDNRTIHLSNKKKYGELEEVYNAMQTCLAWDTIYDPKDNRVITPVSRIWNDQGYKLFCWDTYFAAYMFMLDNKELAYTNAIEITRSRVEKGFVPNFDWSGTNISRDRSQPPVGSLVVLELYRKYGDRWLLEEVFEQLYAWNSWWPKNRQIAEGFLAWGSDSIDLSTGNYWESAGVHDTFGGALESGLDNSPLYDDIPFNKDKNCLELADVGLMSLYIMDCLALAEIAEIVGEQDKADTLHNLAEHYGKHLQRLWDEETGIFRNWRTDLNQFSERLAPTNFYPLLTPYVTEKQTKRMIEEHLYNPEEFWGEWIIPSIARNDPAYPDQDYWRGRIWAPLNFLVYLGLRKQGQADAQKKLAESSVRLILKEWLEHGHVHENYSGDTGEGCNKTNSDRYYHWGGLLSLIALMEHGYLDGPETKPSYDHESSLI
jgi:putative isomerase